MSFIDPFDTQMSNAHASTNCCQSTNFCGLNQFKKPAIKKPWERRKKKKKEREKNVQRLVCDESPYNFFFFYIYYSFRKYLD